MALAVVVVATVVVLGAVDRGGRPVPAEAVAAATTSSRPTPVGPPTVVAPDVTPAVASPVSPPVTSPVTSTPLSTPPVVDATARGAPVTAPPVGTPGITVPRTVVTGDPVQVLEALQRVRATAFSTGRLDLLGTVYPVGSDLVAADRAAFTRLAPAGGTVTGLGFDLREAAVSERTALRAVVTALVRQRPVEVVSGASARRVPGRELGRVRVVLGRPSVTAAWVITASTSVGPT